MTSGFHTACDPTVGDRVNRPARRAGVPNTTPSSETTKNDPVGISGRTHPVSSVKRRITDPCNGHDPARVDTTSWNRYLDGWRSSRSRDSGSIPNVTVISRHLAGQGGAFDAEPAGDLGFGDAGFGLPRCSRTVGPLRMRDLLKVRLRT